jgi:hypothetical protein
MPNELQIISERLTPPPPQMVALEYSLTVALEGTTAPYSISSLAAPSETERAILSERSRQIAAGLGPSPKDMVATRVARLFLRFPNAKPSDGEATAAAYATDLMRFPLWAIDQAILKAIRPNADLNQNFVPTSPQLQALCQEVIGPFVEEARGIAAVLAAITYQPRPETERDRVKKGFAALLADTGKTNRFEPQDPRDRKTQPQMRELAAVQLDHLAAHPTAPALSDPLRIKLGLIPADADQPEERS